VLEYEHRYGEGLVCQGPEKGGKGHRGEYKLALADRKGCSGFEGENFFFYVKNAWKTQQCGTTEMPASLKRKFEHIKGVSLERGGAILLRCWFTGERGGNHDHDPEISSSLPEEEGIAEEKKSAIKNRKKKR